jgi:hypothetical protein
MANQVEQIKQLLNQLNNIKFAFTYIDIQNILLIVERGDVIQADRIPLRTRHYDMANPPILLRNLREKIVQQGGVLERINQIKPVFASDTIDKILANIEIEFLNVIATGYSSLNHLIHRGRPVVQQVPLQPIRHATATRQVVLKKVKTDLTRNDEVCCICDESVCYVETNCKHSYCNCILHQLSKSGTGCPYCRQEITTLTYSQPDQYDAMARLLPIINHGTVKFIEEEEEEEE